MSLRKREELSKLPRAFCWTRMGTEAGQPLEDIIRRKELERRLGDGMFAWGIGNALGDNIELLIQRERQPKILFSGIKGRPQPQDVNPATLLLWHSYVDSYGQTQPLPQHMLVTSRTSRNDISQARHYALICRANLPLKLRVHGSIEIESLRNIKSRKSVGYSQVTAVVEHIYRERQRERNTHTINLIATLTEPYFVRLANPTVISRNIIEKLRHLSAKLDSTTTEWFESVCAVREKH